MYRIHKMKRKMARVGLYLLVTIIVAYTLAPIYWMFKSSITVNEELLVFPPNWLPKNVTFSRYEAIFSGSQIDAWMATIVGPTRIFKQALGNSIIIASVTTIVSLVLGTLSAYAHARLRFYAKKQLQVLTIAVQMLPQVALVVPLFFILQNLGLIDTHTGMILVYCSFTITYVIWMMTGFFNSLPKELEEAARIDGCSRLTSLLRVMLPLSLPGLVSTGILSFLTSWNEFMYSLLFTNTSAKTLPVAVGEFSTQFSVDYGMMMAGGFISCIPPVLLAMLFQRYIINGMSMGAVKG